jgi:tetratricopeptide (TPR) repeat protein
MTANLQRTAPAASGPSARLDQLLRFLDRDPGNLALIADAATAAYDAQALDTAAELVARYAAKAPVPATLANLHGLTALAQQRFADAAAVFCELRDAGHDDPRLRFNLAWAYAMVGRHAEALTLLDDATVAASSRAPALKIQMMHHLGHFDGALACGESLAQRHPDNAALMGALATLAIDAEQPDLARSYAERAGDIPEGLAALGVLTLGANDLAGSMTMFEAALRKEPNNARALMGKGLALLVSGNQRDAIAAIDRGAELFEDHLGSWIASGWAHFTAGDRAGARKSFERALAIDPNFAETHGGLAVLDIADGRQDEAHKRVDIALRLDRNCFGAALAKSMLLEKSGDTGGAQRVRDLALGAPVGEGGQTIAQALVKFGFAAQPPGSRRP